MVRISGAMSRDIPKRFGVTQELKAREARLCVLHDNDELLDKAIVIHYPAPRSYTGEDVVELHLHGGPAVLHDTLAALSRMPGLRPAEPGEFTRRAVESGKYAV